MGEQYKELEKIVRRWTVWYRLRRGVEWAGYGLAAGLGAALLASALGYFQAEILKEEFITINLAGALVGPLLAFISGAVWPLSAVTAARRLDLALNLKERVSTALELAAQAGDLSGISREITEKQLADALETSRYAQPRKGLPLRVNPWTLAAAAICAGITAAIGIFGTEQFQAAAQQREVEQAIAEEIEAIETLREEIEADESLTAEQREELAKPLEEALRKLEESGSLEEAVSILHSTEEKLQELENAQAEASAQALQEAGNALEGSEGTPLESLANNLAGGDILQAAQDLANLDLSSLTAEQMESLAEQLEQLATSLQETDPELAGQLQEAAEALHQGDPGSAQLALSQAAGRLAQTSQQIARSRAARQAAARVGEGRQRMLQPGRTAQASQGQGQGSGSGQGQGQGQGTGSGQGQGQGQGAGGGAGRGEGGGDAGTGSEAGNSPIGQGNDPGDAGERGYEQIYAPQHLGGSEGEDVLLDPSGQPGDEVIGQGNIAPGQEASSTVPYSEVYQEYAESFRQDLSSGEIPPSFRQMVRDYFSALEP